MGSLFFPLLVKGMKTIQISISPLRALQSWAMLAQSNNSVVLQLPVAVSHKLLGTQNCYMHSEFYTAKTKREELKVELVATDHSHHLLQTFKLSFTAEVCILVFHQSLLIKQDSPFFSSLWKMSQALGFKNRGRGWTSRCLRTSYIDTVPELMEV